jgi:O-antigen/teichoic acid export membrane protein
MAFCTGCAAAVIGPRVARSHKRFLNLGPDRLKLGASLAFNLISKVPGIAAVFIILPLVSRSLGTADYGELLSALAIGSVFNLPFGGINAVGRRLLAKAVGAEDRAQQANVFMTTIALMSLVASVDTIIMIAVTARGWSRPIFIFICTLPAIAGFSNVFDNLRASFNELYVTAIFQFAFQVVIYAAVYHFGVPQGNVVLSGLAMQSAFILASWMTLLTLLAQRPYLASGKLQGMQHMLLPTLGVVMADGSLAILLNLTVYWLNLVGSKDMAAWLGTFSRLFQSFMGPMLLVLFPVTSYVSIRWDRMTSQRQTLLYDLFLVMGSAFGILVGVAMAFAGPFYISHMFKLTATGDRRDLAAISLFMAAVIAQKAYTMLLYAVTEARFVSFGTAVIAGVGLLLAAGCSRFFSPMAVIDILYAFIGFALPTMMVIAAIRHRRHIRGKSLPASVG